MLSIRRYLYVAADRFLYAENQAPCRGDIFNAGKSRCRLCSKIRKSSLHLTSRGSVEIHWIEEENLSEVKRVLASAGLTSRDACGGAVRGVSTS